MTYSYYCHNYQLIDGDRPCDAISRFFDGAPYATFYFDGYPATPADAGFKFPQVSKYTLELSGNPSVWAGSNHIPVAQDTVTDCSGTTFTHVLSSGLGTGLFFDSGSPVDNPGVTLDQSYHFAIISSDNAPISTDFPGPTGDLIDLIPLVEWTGSFSDSGTEPMNLGVKVEVDPPNNRWRFVLTRRGYSAEPGSTTVAVDGTVTENGPWFDDPDHTAGKTAFMTFTVDVNFTVRTGSYVGQVPDKIIRLDQEWTINSYHYDTTTETTVNETLTSSGASTLARFTTGSGNAYTNAVMVNGTQAAAVHEAQGLIALIGNSENPINGANLHQAWLDNTA